VAYGGTVTDRPIVCVSDAKAIVEPLETCLDRGGAYIKSELSAIPFVKNALQAGLLTSAVEQYLIAGLYRQSNKTPEDQQQLLRWFELSAKQDYFPALVSLGEIYAEGDLVAKDLVVSSQYFRRAYHDNDLSHSYLSAIASFEKREPSPSDAVVKLQQATDKHKQLKETLDSQLEIKNNWQRELKSINDGFAPAEFLNDKFVEKSAQLKSLANQSKATTDVLQQQRKDISRLLTELNGSKQNFSAAGVEVIQQDISDKRSVLNAEIAQIDYDKAEYQQLVAKRESVPTSSAANDGRMAMSNNDKRVAFDRYLQDQEKNLERRTVSANKRKKKLDFLQKRIDKLKKANKRKVSSDDAVVLQRALKEINHRYQGKVDYLATVVKKEKTTVADLAQQLDISDKASQDKDRYIDVVKQELNKASSLVKQQSKLVNQQSKDLEQAIKQMKALHPQQGDLAGQSPVNKKTARVGEQEAPKIVIKWPEFEQQGSKKVASVPAGSIVNVVGAVYSPAEVIDFSIDGEAVKLDVNGLFMKSLEVSNLAVTVDFAMRDELGQEIQTKMQIEPYQRPSSNVRQSDKFGKYYALVIGNNDYNDANLAPLDTAVNDAQAIAAVLQEKYDFEVELLLNGSRDQVLDALDGMRSKLTENDNLLIYYAGHGVLDPENDQGYWVPVDGSSSSTKRLISNATITDQIRGMSAKNIMVIADSCYSGSLMRSGVLALRSGLTPEKQVQRFESDVAASTRVVLSSGGLQPVADSIGASKHSVFTGAMLRVLEDNYQLLDADSLATSVSHTVAVETKDNVRQVPRFAPLPRAGHEGGDFYFVPNDWRQ